MNEIMEVNKMAEFIMNEFVMWAIAILIFSVLEAITAQLVSIWFVLGSVGAIIAAACDASIFVQVSVFIVVSVLALLITRPLVKKYVRPKIQKTNADRSIGQEAVIIQQVNNLVATGQAKLGGNVWTVRSADGSVIEEGEIVIVEEIEGVKLIVKPKQKSVV